MSASCAEALPHWPYPRWIAHRGAGKLAPENTLAAFRLGASHGYRMFECDVKLSADEQPFLMHDATLERTTNGQGTGGDLPWHTLATLDAGSWHSRRYAGEPLPSLDNIARYCRHNGHALNIEIKPTPGVEHRTGVVVAQHAAQFWALPSNAFKTADAGLGEPSPTLPLLTSFSPDALRGAQAAAPQLPRGLLLDTPETNWLETALSLGCVAIICNHSLWNTSTVAQAKRAGFRTLSYTVNDESTAERLIALGTDGIITDRVDLFAPHPG
jgi:glycerophosphoryl diester phosphodiesterase